MADDDRLEEVERGGRVHVRAARAEPRAEWGKQERDDNEAGSLPGALPGNLHLTGRANAPVRAALMLRAQQAQGNRAVQRAMIRAVQRQEGAGGTPPAPTPGTSPEKGGGNPTLAAAWRAAVTSHVETALVDLEGEPDTSDIRAASQEVGSAVQSVRDISKALPAGTTNALVDAKLISLTNELLIEKRQIDPHLGRVRPIRAIRAELEDSATWCREGGKAVARVSTAGRTAPSGAAPTPTAAPGTSGATAAVAAHSTPGSAEGAMAASPAPAAESTGNPLVEAAWNAAVTRPVTEAEADLRGKPKKPQIRAASQKVGRAAEASSDVALSLPRGPANEVTVETAFSLSNALEATAASIEAHAGDLTPIADIYDSLDFAKMECDWAGEALAGGPVPGSPGRIEGEIIRTPGGAGSAAPAAPEASTEQAGTLRSGYATLAEIVRNIR